MYTDKLTRGDHYSVGDELLIDVSDIELRCKAVEKSVKLNYFSFDDALSNYEVSISQYTAYSLMNTKFKGNREHQIFETIKFVLSIVKPSTQSFNLTSKKAINKLLEISEATLEKV